MSRLSYYYLLFTSISAVNLTGHVRISNNVGGLNRRSGKQGGASLSLYKGMQSRGPSLFAPVSGALEPLF